MGGGSGWGRSVHWVGLGPARGNTLGALSLPLAVLTSPCFQEEFFILVLAVTTPTDPLTIVLKRPLKCFKMNCPYAHRAFVGIRLENVYEP